MKKFLKVLGSLLGTLIIVAAIYYFVKNEPLPEGIKGKEADTLALKMLSAMNNDAFKNTEILEWSFRGKHQYKWRKQEAKVEVSWNEQTVVLDLNDHANSQGKDKEAIQKALDYFNNDSFWLVAPYKIFDEGTERSIVKQDGKDALLVTYTSGGSTPGDSYLWTLDSNYIPTSYKMWVKIIPIGGVSATWNDLSIMNSGIKLPSKHTLSIFGMELDMGEVKAYNPKADALANKILKAIKHEAYKNTRYIDWSFGGRRHYKWDKQKHIVEVSWNDVKVILHPNNLEKSTAFLKSVETQNKDSFVKRAWDLFNNDSFWLVAPHKLYDSGIIRSIVVENGQEALHVKYTTGGTTPGDSYTWIIDSNYVPKSYKMYVPSMKMVGTPATWEEWITTESGTLLPKNHTFSGNRKLSMGDVKAYN